MAAKSVTDPARCGTIHSLANAPHHRYSTPVMATRGANKKKTTPKRAPAGSAGSAGAHRRTRDDHARELAEDYVELIDDLIRETGEARAVEVAARLGVTHVTVANTINRLKRAGLVTSEPYRSIFLTKEGKTLADAARDRHILVLDFLLALGVTPTEAAIDAEGIEHHLSPSTLQAMKRFLARGR